MSRLLYTLISLLLFLYNLMLIADGTVLNNQLKKNNLVKKKKIKKKSMRDRVRNQKQIKLNLRKGKKINKVAVSKKSRLSTNIGTIEPLFFQNDKNNKDIENVQLKAYIDDIVDLLFLPLIKYGSIIEYINLYYFPNFTKKLNNDEKKNILSLNFVAQEIEESFFEGYLKEVLDKNSYLKEVIKSYNLTVGYKGLSFSNRFNYEIFFSKYLFQEIKDKENQFKGAGIINSFFKESSVSEITDKITEMIEKYRILEKSSGKKVDTESIIFIEKNKNTKESFLTEEDLFFAVKYTLSSISLESIFLCYNFYLLLSNNYISEKELAEFFYRSFFIKNKEEGRRNFNLFKVLLFEEIPLLFNNLCNILNKYAFLLDKSKKNYSISQLLQLHKDLTEKLPIKKNNRFFSFISDNKKAFGLAAGAAMVGAGFYFSDKIGPNYKDLFSKENIFQHLVNSPIGVVLQYASQKIGLATMAQNSSLLRNSLTARVLYWGASTYVTRKAAGVLSEQLQKPINFMGFENKLVKDAPVISLVNHLSKNAPISIFIPFEYNSDSLNNSFFLINSLKKTIRLYSYLKALFTKDEEAISHLIESALANAPSARDLSVIIGH